MLLISALDHISSLPRELNISVLPQQQNTMDLLTVVMHLEYDGKEHVYIKFESDGNACPDVVRR